jgi:hypothetical protein
MVTFMGFVLMHANFFFLFSKMRTIGSKFSLGTVYLLKIDLIFRNLNRSNQLRVFFKGFTALMNGFFALLVALVIAKFTFGIHLTFGQLW